MNLKNIDEATLIKLCQEMANISARLKLIEYRKFLLDYFSRPNFAKIPNNLTFIVNILTSIITAGPKNQKEVRDLAYAFLVNTAAGQLEDVVGEAWIKTRNAELGQLIRQRQLVSHATLKNCVLMRLQSGVDSGWCPYSVEELAREFLRVAEDEKELELRPRAITRLKNLATSNNFYIVESLWRDTQSRLLLDILIEINHQSTYMPLAFWMAFYIEARESFLTTNVMLLKLLLDATQNDDPVIIERALQHVKKITDTSIQNETCRQVILYEYPLVQKTIVEWGWQPVALNQRALFFFITGQWDKYDELDFDRRTLQVIYSEASRNVRQKIAAAVRISGRTEYLSILTGFERNREKELNSAEAEVVIETLMEHEQWEELWELAPKLPLAQSMAIVWKLEKIGWQAKTTEVQEKLTELINLAASLEEVKFEELQRQLLVLPLVQNNRAYSILATAELNPTHGKEKITDVAFSPKRPVLALVMPLNRIVLWNMQTAAVEQVIISDSDRTIGLVAFTESDILCWAEETTDGRECKIYRQDKTEIGQHNGSVTGLLAYQGDQLISAGQDGRIILWEVNTRQELASYDVGSTLPFARPPHGMSLSHNKKYLSVLHNKLHVLTLPDFRVVGSSSFGGDHISEKTVFTPDDADVLLFSKGRFARWANFSAGPGFSSEVVAAVEVIEEFAYQRSHYVPGALTIPELDLIIVINESGELDFLEWSSQKVVLRSEIARGSQKLIAKKRKHDSYLTLLKAAPSKKYLALVDTTGQISIHDLGLLPLQHLFKRSLAGMTAIHFAAIKLLRESYPDLCTPELISILRYVEKIISFRLRYEIEVEEIPTLQAGEFDIELG